MKITDLLSTDTLSTIILMAHAPGAIHLTLVVGIAVGSMLLENWLKRRGREDAATAVHAMSYLTGGLITLDLFFRLLRRTAGTFGLSA